jgi:tRNA-dihydrouridine synthase
MLRRDGAAGVMIGRGSFGQPWIFDQARALLDGTSMPATPAVSERFAIALEHARMAADFEPDRRGAAIEFRKHLGWYVKGLPGSAELRRRLHAVDSLGEVEGSSPTTWRRGTLRGARPRHAGARAAEA